MYLEEECVVGQLGVCGLEGGEDSGHGHGGGALIFFSKLNIDFVRESVHCLISKIHLDVVVEGAVLVPVLLQEAEGVLKEKHINLKLLKIFKSGKSPGSRSPRTV